MGMNDTHYNKKSLKERGWTDELIAELLGSPDATKVNMYRKNERKVCFYAKDRVHSVESGKAFLDDQAARVNRREAARRTAEAKRERRRRWLDAVEIVLPGIDEEELTRQAIDHYSARSAFTGGLPDSMAQDRVFVDSITVDYLRREVTSYKRLLMEAKGRVGAAEARLGIEEKFLDAIAKVYPHLAGECGKQARQVRDDARLPC